jgi:F420-dependent oxidoreductase-like protein
MGKELKLGYNTGYWSAGPPAGVVEAIAEADRLGLDSIWAAEAYGSDCLTPLAWWGSRTENVRLGTGILQMSARQPAAAAMAAMTLDHLSGGRVILGIGVSGPQVVEGWYGMPFAKPLARTREYVGILRDVWARRGPLTADGPHYPLPIEGGTGLGKPLKLLARPVQERIPIYLGSMGPKAIEQTARIADGWLPSMFSPELAEPFRGTNVDISPVVMVCVDEDIDRARDLARPWLTVYLGGMGSKEKNFYVEAAERSGEGEAAREVQRRYLEGDRAGAAAALTPELIDSSAVCCRPAELDEHLARYERAGATTLLAMPFGDRPAIVDQLASANQTG